MNDNDQRTAIAEACGWQRCEIDQNMSGVSLWPKDIEVTTDTHGIMWPPNADKAKDHATMPPRYLCDLNAMHAAIMVLPQETRDKMNGVLMDMLNPDKAHVLDRTINATAAQRAQAFLRAVGKWTDDPPLAPAAPDLATLPVTQNK